MWSVRRNLSTCLRRGFPLLTMKTSLAPTVRCCTTSSTQLLHRSTPSLEKGIGLSYTCRLLNSICAAEQPYAVKRKRIRGAVHKMEAGIVDSLAVAKASLGAEERRELMRRWLRALSRSVMYLPRCDEGHNGEGMAEAGVFSSSTRRHSSGSAVAATSDEAAAWSGASPFFSLQTNDVLCLCLRECVLGGAADVQHDERRNDLRSRHDYMRELLKDAVTLELGDVEALQHLVHVLTTVEACRHHTPMEAVQLLHDISLAVKRCKLPAPPLDRLLSVLPGATLSARESLMVLGALHRISTVHAGDVVASVSRKATAQVPSYNVKDVVYGLEVAALLPGCHEAYARAVLDRAGVLAPSMTPRQLGAVCKYVALLNPTCRQNTLAYSCGTELRRLLPLLVERAEQLLGHFHLRDSRNVLRCFREHKVRHSLIFSRLTPVAEDK
ncbi:hypothetical protein NQL31_004272 [Lotmaria passim]